MRKTKQAIKYNVIRVGIETNAAFQENLWNMCNSDSENVF
jgi:hypothetical protein